MNNSRANAAARADVELAEFDLTYAKLAMVPHRVNKALNVATAATGDYHAAMTDLSQQLAVDSRGDPGAAEIARLAIDAISINTSAMAGHESHGRLMRALNQFMASDARLEALKAAEGNGAKVQVGGAEVLATVTPGLVTATPIAVAPSSQTGASQAQVAPTAQRKPRKGFDGPKH